MSGGTEAERGAANSGGQLLCLQIEKAAEVKA